MPPVMTFIFAKFAKAEPDFPGECQPNKTKTSWCMKSESRKWMTDLPPDCGKVWGWTRLNPAGKTGRQVFILCPMGTLIKADSCNL